MLAVSCLRAPILAAAASSVESQTTVSVPDSRRAFSYSRASPSVRWPDLQLEEPDKTLDWITLAKEADAQRALHDAHHPLDDAHHAHNDGIGAPTDGHDHHPIDPPRSTITGFTPPLNPYIAAHARSYRSNAAQSSFVADLIEPKARARRPNGRLIRLSKLALTKAKDWRERVQRLSTAICSLGAKDSVADLLKEWHEQLAPTDMCFVLKRVGDIDWQRALELYEWYNLRHWYEPNARMLAGMLSILSRVHQVSLAKEIFDRAELGVGNCVQVYNAMMSVYARQGYCDKVQGLLTLMKQQGCDPDLITYNTVINARCKAGLMPGMAVQLLKDMKKDRLTPDVITYNTLISACASRNDCAEAEKIFHTMKVYRCEPDLWTYNALISLYGRSSGKEDTAIEYFDVIQKKGLVPDAVTYNSVLYAFAKSGRVDDVDKVRMQMTEAGCSADEITYNTMISMYGKLGLHEKALSLYQEMRNEDCRPDAVTFTVLIDALGKAGLVNEAENIFQEMADSEVRPTLQAFSAMIYAYAKAGKSAAAQSTYDCMLQTGIVPDNLAFCLILDVLQKASLPQKGMALYQRAVKRSFVPELGVYGILLQWFTQKGLSKEVDIVSNDLICSGFTCAEVCDTFLNADLPERAAQLLESALAQGSSVSEQLLLDVLQSFGVLAKYHEAQLFVSSLSSFAPDLGPLIHEALIAMLAKAKLVVAVKDEIEKVRTCAKPLSLDTYRILITLFYDAEMLDQVMLVSSEMQSFGIELDEVCEKCVTSACGKLNAVDSGHRPVSSLTLGGNTNLTLDSFISRIEAFGKQHLWERAESTFRELQEAGYRPSLRAWNTLISAFAICGEYENARFALAEMIADGKMPTACTCNAMLQAVINAGRLRDICNVLQEMRQYGVSPGKNIFLAILDSSANEGKVQVAKAAFQELKGAGYLPNMQVYKSLILLFARVRLVRDAENMIKEMESDGFSPDVTIYNNMITLYGKMGYYRKGAEVFTGMQAAECSPDSYTFNSLIWLYSKCLKIQEALAIVRQMEKAGFVPDVESYTALISACGRLRMQEAAEVLFKDAYESGCKLNYKVFHAMMNVYRNVGQPEQVKKILSKMRAANIAPTLGTFHVLMDSYGKGGDPKQAEAVLDAMQEAGFSPGPLQYAGVINAYLRNKDNEQAIGKLLSLKNEGFEPDYMVWTAVVGAASHCKESCEAVRLLSALADVGFSLPLRLLKEKNLGLVAEFDQILQGLEVFGQEAGLGLVNVLLDLLWAFQMRATAARLFTVAIQRKLYSSTMARVQVKDWCADLRRLSAGAALVALTLWLDQMQDAALQGFPESPKFVTLVTGCNQSARNKISVEQTVKVHLWSMGSPFLKSESRTGLFEAKGYSLRHWLKDSPHCMDMKLRNFSVLPEMNSMQVHGGAFMPARLVSGLQQIEESIGDLRPKKFHRLIHLTEMKRNQVIFAELKAREEMVRKGRRVNLKGKRKAKLRKRLHRIQPVK